MSKVITKGGAAVWSVSSKLRKYFEERIFFWQDILGVQDVEFLICDGAYFTNVTDGSREKLDLGTAAAYKRYSDSGAVNVALAEVMTFKPTKVSIDKSAFHEVFEVGYIYKLRAMAFGTYNEFDVEEQVHKSVRQAERTIFYAMRRKRGIKK